MLTVISATCVIPRHWPPGPLGWSARSRKRRRGSPKPSSQGAIEACDMGLKFRQAHVGCDVNARYGESVDLGAKTAARIHECTAEARLLRQSQISFCDRSGIPEGIPKGPHGLPQNFLKYTPALGDLPPSHVLGCPRENRVGERMGSNTHSRSGQLP